MASAEPDLALAATELLGLWDYRGRGLAAVAKALAGTDPARALRIVADLRPLEQWTFAVGDVLAGAGPKVPDVALPIARTLPPSAEVATALARMASRWPVDRPEERRELAQRVMAMVGTDQLQGFEAPHHALTAESLATFDMDLGLHVAACSGAYANSARAKIAQHPALTDPPAAMRLIAELDSDSRMSSLAAVVRLMVQLAGPHIRVMRTVHPELVAVIPLAAEALAFARLIDPAHWRTSAVADVAADIALVDEAAGADLARQIVSVDARVSAMLQVADVCESWNPALSEDLRQDARRTPTEMTEDAERATALVSAALAVVAGDRNLAIDLARQAEAIVVRPVVAAHDARPDTPGHNSQYTAQYVASRIGGLDIDDGLAACAGLDEFNAERAIAEMVERWASVDPRRALALVERLRAGGGEAVLFDIPLGLAKATRADMAVTVALAIPDADLDAADKIALLRRALELAHPSWQASLRISGILLGVAPSPGLATAILKSAEW